MMDLGGPEGNEGAAGADGNPAAAVGKKSATATFTPKQKEDIVRKVSEEHISPQDLGKEYGISPHTIRDWVKKAGKTLPARYKKTAPVVTTVQASTTAAGVVTTQAGGAAKDGDAATPTSAASPNVSAASAASSSAAAAAAPVAPKRVPGKLALCKQCGNLSEDHATCTRCKRRLPDDVKVVDDPAFKPKPDSTTLVSSSSSAADKKSNLRAVRLGTKKARNAMSNEPVCIALSSDEDGEGDDDDTNDAIPHDELEETVDLEELGGKLNIIIIVVLIKVLFMYRDYIQLIF